MTRDLNYYDTFIAVAGDARAAAGRAPRVASVSRSSATPTVAQVQFAMLDGHPYEHDQNDVLFAASVRARGGLDALDADERAALRERFLSRPQACLRASPLPRTHGWGVHCDHAGRIALYGVETDAYRRLVADPSLTQRPAMRSARAR